MGSINMTSGSIYKHMLSFTLPIFISQLFQQLYNVADSVIVGKFLTTSALAAVSSSGTMIWLFISFFEGVATGAGVLISKNFGKGDRDAVSRSVHTTLAAAFVSGLILTAAGMLLTSKLLILINTDPQIIPEASEYFRCYFAGSLALVVYNISRGIMMAVGDSRRPLYYLIFSSLLNIGLDLLFVGAFHWGVWSAAIATVISEFVSAVLCIIQLCRKNSVTSVTLSKIRFHRDEIIDIVKYGFPSGIQNSVIGLANIVVQSQINSFGMIATAAFGACSKVEGFVFLPIMSFNVATTTFVSQNLGAREYDRAKRGARFGIATGVVIAALIGFIYLIFRTPIIKLFTSDAEVLALSAVQIKVMVPFYGFVALAHSIASVCRGAGKASVPMYTMLGCWCVFRIAYIMFVMKLTGELKFIYMAYPITWIMSDIIFVIYYLRSDWVHGFEKEKEMRGVQVQ